VDLNLHQKSTLITTLLHSSPPQRNFDTFRKRSYPDWKLEDISIYFDCWAEADVALMEAFAHSVPAIKSFCGQGHMGKPCAPDAHRQLEANIEERFN
jgi:hypothetical protein